MINVGLIDIVQMHNKLGGKASVREIAEKGREEKLDDTVTHKLKVRDSLVRLSKKGIVKEEQSSEDYFDKNWILIRQPTEDDLKIKRMRKKFY